jgi:uncharacterized protein YdbL (DUF1318 family)
MAQFARAPATMILARMRLAAMLALAALLALAWPAADATAATLDDYRRSGVIAERYDGYVELRGGGAPAEAAQLVKQVNAERRAIYEQRAREQKVPVAAVGELFAAKIAQSGAPPGTYFRLRDGSYQRK